MKHLVAVVGLGGIAQKGHLPVLLAMENVELIYYGRHEEKVKPLAEQHRVARSTTKLEQLLDWGVNAAVILTPVPSHKELAEFFLNAAVDVMLEKPAGGTAADAREMARLADEKERILMVAYNRRFAPLSIKAKELWGDRPVTLANFQKSRSKPGYQGLYYFVNEELIHVIDLMRFLCGEAEALHTSYTLGENESVLEVLTCLKLAGGGYATITASSQAGEWYEHYELNGGRSTLRMNCFYDLQLIDEKSSQSWIEPYASQWTSNLVGRGFVGQIEHFFQCVESRQQPMTNGWDSVKTQELVEDIMAKIKP
jgi:virulence factor